MVGSAYPNGPLQSLIPHSPNPNSPSEGAGIHQGEEKALEDALPSMVRLFCPPCSQVGLPLLTGAGELLTLALSFPAGWVS